MKKNSGFKCTSGLTQFRKFTNNVNLSINFTRHILTHTLSFLSGGDSPKCPAKECDDFCKDSAPIIFGEMVNSCSCSVKIRSS